MSSKSMLFHLPGELGVVEFSHKVLIHFEKHVQKGLFSCEAGGQLFANIGDQKLTKVIDITGPRSTDKRSVFKYIPDRAVEKMEISERYENGLHFVGDWHTHRQKIPTPSPSDIKSMNELVRHSSYDLAGFFMVIIGQAKFPSGIHVSFYTKAGSVVLTPLETW